MLDIVLLSLVLPVDYVSISKTQICVVVMSFESWKFNQYFQTVCPDHTKLIKTNNYRDRPV